ncbi:ROK family protein [Lacticaseibacillus zhaodongensis]|uniref:ROK family protein n=1 Tax=Lacticaseibacillus zhaodongensis TaxID=2668065 RepID=UPI0012D2A440|nr:ROK family protein [Lacticaseibacillus zhaodongensis]
MSEIRLGSIEAGGTKFVLAVTDGDYNVLLRKRVPTTTPEDTLAAAIEFFMAHPVAALGIGSFGPIDIMPDSPTYGHILKTPKQGWADTDVLDPLRAALDIPIAFTTDVNASAYGEYKFGAGRGVNSLVYFTIGTGIGGGAIQNGQFIGGVAHSEMGHAPVIAHPDDDFAGLCPFHGNRCFEGMAAGPTIEARTGIPGEKLDRSNPVFDYISYYAAQMAYSAYVNLAPARIVFGGSVLSDAELPKIRKYFAQLNNGYVQHPALDELIVRSQVPDNGSATVGDAALAQNLLA